MKFKVNKLPSSSSMIKSVWERSCKNNVVFSKVTINENLIDFTKRVDYFNLSEETADKISIIGRRYDFFTSPISLKEFELRIFGNLNVDTQIGVLLSNITHLRASAEVYGIYATFIYVNESLYCAFTICYVDKDFGQEMETAVVEIGQDEEPYIVPIVINEEALDYFSYDDIAKLSFWLANFWVGTQYEMNNKPEEIRVVEQRELQTNNNEDYKNNHRIVLVKQIVPIDENGKRIKYSAIDSKHHYSLPAWGVSGHWRRLKNGKEIYISPYLKGKDRKKSKIFSNKEYRFVDDKIDLDAD